MSEVEQPADDHAARQDGAEQPTGEQAAEQAGAEQLTAEQPLDAVAEPTAVRGSRLRSVIDLILLVLVLAVLGLVAWMRLTDRGQQAELALREYLGFEAGASEAEFDAAEQLRKHGVQVVSEPPDHHVTSVNFKPAFAGKPVDEHCLRLLANFPEVVSISLAETLVTDEQLRYLDGLDKLASLQLGGTAVGDAGLAHLKGLPELTVLHLIGTQVSDAGLKHVAAIPSLRILDLRNTQVTDAGLKELQPLDELEHLLLGGPQITDDGLKHLYALKGLGRLTEGPGPAHAGRVQCDRRGCQSAPGRAAPAPAGRSLVA